MGKKTYKDINSLIVVVSPDKGYLRPSFDNVKKTCDDIKAQIERHIDNIDAVEIQWNTIEECEFCGAPWTEDTEHNGGCCDDDLKLRQITCNPTTISI